MKAHSLAHSPRSKKILVDEIIERLEIKVSDYSRSEDNQRILVGLQELHAHSTKGLHAVKAKNLSPNEEWMACRSHLTNLIRSLENMSHTSNMVEMEAAQKVLQNILNELIKDMAAH